MRSISWKFRSRAGQGRAGQGRAVSVSRQLRNVGVWSIKAKELEGVEMRKTGEGGNKLSSFPLLLDGRQHFVLQFCSSAITEFIT